MSLYHHSEPEDTRAYAQHILTPRCNAPLYFLRSWEQTMSPSSLAMKACRGSARHGWNSVSGKKQCGSLPDPRQCDECRYVKPAIKADLQTHQSHIDCAYSPMPEWPVQHQGCQGLPCISNAWPVPVFSRISSGCTILANRGALGSVATSTPVVQTFSAQPNTGSGTVNLLVPRTPPVAYPLKAPAAFHMQGQAGCMAEGGLREVP